MISFASVTKYLKHTPKKEVGFSHERIGNMWALALMLALVLILTGGAYAGYVFMDIEKADEVVLTEPIETTRYNDVQIRAVLENYRARAEFLKKHHVPGATPIAEPVPSPSSEEETAEVAPAGDVRVE